MRLRLLALPCVCCTFTLAAHAADEVDTCVNASEQAQKQRDEGRYLEARENLLICSRDVCPDVVVKDCVDQLAAVEKAIPSVVFGVQGLDPDALAKVRVSIDDGREQHSVDGKPVQVNPGWHTVVFRTAEGREHRSKVLVKVGERNRVVEATFPSASKQPEALPDTKPEPEEPATSWTGYALLAGGTLALGGSAYFWIRGRGDLDDLRGGCGVTSSCAQSDVDDARRTILVGDILGGVGVIALGTGAYLVLTGPAEPERSSTSSVTVAGTAGPDAGGVLLTGSF